MSLRSLGSILAITLALTACKKADADGTSTPEPTEHQDHAKGHEGGMGHGDVEGKPVVNNYEAQTGDVAVCPVSGEKFVVTDESPRMEWEGKSWVFCCPMCLGKVEADPETHLRPLVEAPQPEPE